MAFPTIPTAGASRVLSVVSLDTSGGTVTSPSLSSLTKNAGDLLIAICIVYDGNSTNAEFSSWGGSFTEFVDQATTATMGIGCAYKFSTGSETGTFTVAVAGGAAGSDAAFFLLSIPGAHASTPPEGGTIANGTTTAANPGSFAPSWGAEDTLWIAVGASGETSTTGSYTGIASAPANYSNYAESGISADAVGGVEGAVAFRRLNAASEDVGAFSLDVSNARSSALTLAVRQAAVATVSGTITSTATETDIVAGGQTIIITLAGDSWKAAGTGPIGSTADTQAIIDGLDSAQSEGTGWDAVVRPGIETADVVRTSSKIATITLDAEATYDITAQETVTVTVPAAAVDGATAIAATPTFTIDIASTGNRRRRVLTLRN